MLNFLLCRTANNNLHRAFLSLRHGLLIGYRAAKPRHIFLNDINSHRPGLSYLCSDICDYRNS